MPKYFIEDRAKELDDRDKFLEVKGLATCVKTEQGTQPIPPWDL